MSTSVLSGVCEQAMVAVVPAKRQSRIIISRNTVNTKNAASQNVHAKFSPRIYAKGRYLKILWWKFWTEKPLVHEALAKLNVDTTE